MEQSSLYKCDKCDYSSKFNHNLLRHQRSKHRVVELASDYDGETESNAPPPPQVHRVPDPNEVEEEEDDGLTYDDLEVMISDKINKVLKGNNLPTVSKKATQSAVKTFMGGNTASLLAGICIGYLITANAGAILKMMNPLNGSLPVATQGQPTQAQVEMMRRIIAQQQQAQTQPSPPPPPPVAVSSQSGLEDASPSTL